MKYLMASVLGLSILAGCGDHRGAPKGDDQPVDAKDLAKRFIAPANEIDKPRGAIVFNDKGEVIAITADGKLARMCRLPDQTGTKADVEQTTADQGAAKLPVCEGTDKTALYSISTVTIVRHTGSDCWLGSSGSKTKWQDCW